MDPLTLAQAAAALGVEPGTLRRQVKLGRLKARKLGSIWVVDQEEVERYRVEVLGKKGPRPKD